MKEEATKKAKRCKNSALQWDRSPKLAIHQVSIAGYTAAERGESQLLELACLKGRIWKWARLVRLCGFVWVGDGTIVYYHPFLLHVKSCASMQ